MKMRLVGLICALSFTPILEGCPSCPYEESCEGNVLKYCYLGVDQLVGSPDEGSKACASPNPICATVDAQNAVCAIDAARTCTVGAAPRCEAALLVSCEQGYDVAYDCALHGNLCATVGATAQCRRDPLVTCVAETHEARCVGTLIEECRGGVIATRDCAIEYAGGTCKTTQTDYGPSTYCMQP
jgi:hypothetical protein